MNRDITVIKKIVLHRSQSSFGNKQIITHWHTAPKPAGNGWDGPGYHHLIRNAYPTAESYSNGIPVLICDGQIEDLMPYTEVGRHCYGHNTKSIGICMVGDTTFTAKQLYALKHLVFRIRQQFGDLPIYGHDELATSSIKVCPHIDMDFIREFVNTRATPTRITRPGSAR